MLAGYIVQCVCMCAEYGLMCTQLTACTTTPTGCINACRHYRVMRAELRTRVFATPFRRAPVLISLIAPVCATCCGTSAQCTHQHGLQRAHTHTGVCDLCSWEHLLHAPHNPAACPSYTVSLQKPYSQPSQLLTKYTHFENFQMAGAVPDLLLQLCTRRGSHPPLTTHLSSHCLTFFSSQPQVLSLLGGPRMTLKRMKSLGRRRWFATMPLTCCCRCLPKHVAKANILRIAK